MKAHQLKNAILQLAVQGKLVPQNPNDEPASKLLQRIAAEKRRRIKAGEIKKDKRDSTIIRRGASFYEIANTTERCIDDELPFDLPKGWEWARLANVVYNRGQCTPHTDFCYIDIGSINNINQTLNSNETIISPKAAPSRARKLVCYGDILYATVRPYLHNMCIIDKEFSHPPIASTGFAVLTCCNDLFNKFLFYYLLSPIFDSYANDLENSKGVAYPSINDGKLYKALIPIPPLAEQRRIVDRLESLLPLVEAYGKAEAELSELDARFPDMLKKSILQDAVQGKLVPQNPNDEPASVLLERIRAEKQRLIKEGKIKKDKRDSTIVRRGASFYEIANTTERCIDDELPFVIPESWEWVYLGSISFITKLAGFEYTNYIAPALTSHGIPLFKGKNIQNGKLIEHFEGFIPETVSDELWRSQLTKRCLLTPYVGSIGNVAVFPGTYKAHLGSNVGKIEPYSDNGVLIEYILYYLRSVAGYEQLTKHKKATAQESISIEAIRNVLMPIPPLAEQRRIVARIESLFSTLSIR